MLYIMFDEAFGVSKNGFVQKNKFCNQQCVIASLYHTIILKDKHIEMRKQLNSKCLLFYHIK
jgi:hypothetical protein